MIRRRQKNPGAVEPQPVTVERSSLLQSVTRFWLSMLFIAALVYGALLVVGTTPGFRNLIEQKAETLTGLKIKIGKARIGFDLKVRVRGVRGYLKATNEVAALEIERLAAKASLIDLVREEGFPFAFLSASDAVVRFSRGEAGWRPMPVLAGAIASWMNVIVVSNQPAFSSGDIQAALTRRDIRVSLQNVRILYLDELQPDLPLALADGLFLDVAGIQPFDERALWAMMKVHSLQQQGVEWMSDLELEWIRQKDQDVILRISKTTESAAPALPPASREVN